MVVNDVDGVPSHAPQDVRAVVPALQAVEQQYHERFAWAGTAALLLLLWRKGSGRVAMAMAFVDAAPGAHSAPDLVRRHGRRRGRPPRADGTYLAVAAMADGLSCVDSDKVPIAALPGETPMQTAERLADLIADGSLAQGRVVAATLGSGWRVEVQRDRRSGTCTVVLHEPGESAPHELAEAVDDVHAVVAW